MKVEFYRHSLGEIEIATLAETIHSVFLTTGPRTALFEKEFADFLKVSHAIGVSSCTSGLFLCLKAWGIGAGDKVIVPAQTFIATANVVIHAGAVPVFCDVEKETGCLDMDCVEQHLATDTLIKAVIPVHLYGHMADMHRLRAIANKYSVKILEDAAHCVEGSRDGYGPGHLGDAVVFSFYATKNMSCGEGGTIATNNQILAHKLSVLRLHGMNKSASQRHNSYQHWDMEELGYKANMNDLQAAMLIPQLSKIQEQLNRREEISQKYESAFRTAGIKFPLVHDGTVSARHLFTIHVNPEYRDDILVKLQSSGIGIAVNYRAVHLRKYYRERYGFQKGQFPVAEQIGNSTISLPLYPNLTQEEIEYVIKSTINVCNFMD
jgi:dTDP-4-amino-4,6-dideoxygalactose transaminase